MSVNGRLAVFGDIHGNVAALDAVIAAIGAAGITDAICTGDIVMRGTEPEECIARMRATGWPIVGGNTDRKVSNKTLKPDTELRGMRPGTRTWTRAVLSDADAQWLGSLPAMVKADLGPHRLVAMMDALGADVLVAAHTHAPMLRRVRGRLIINPGSVGEGTVDDQRPAWAWLEATDDGIHAAIEHVDAPLAPPRAKHHRKGA